MSAPPPAGGNGATVKDHDTALMALPRASAAVTLTVMVSPGLKLAGLSAI